ncbi:amidohydrolase family protein [Variovorax sp. LjRoot84]|uniref:amidohydrolase family protein n=1 Tax=Variovorax sp. LjRoot84 TaxID=3342340 RepID=UPI003F512C31
MTLPPLATDCHVHVFDPERFPYAPDRRYTPPPATVEALQQMHATLGIERVVLVQPSVYSADNRCLMDALVRLGPSARGIAVIDASFGRREVEALHGAGIRGVRINLHVTKGSGPGAAVQVLQETAKTLGDVPMLIQLYASLPVLLACAPTLRAMPQRVLIDHFGLAMAAAGPKQAGFADLLDLLSSESVWRTRASHVHRQTTRGASPGNVPAPLPICRLAPDPRRSRTLPLRWSGDRRTRWRARPGREVRVSPPRPGAQPMKPKGGAGCHRSKRRDLRARRRPVIGRRPDRA